MAEIYFAEGFWHPNVVGGKVHDHPAVGRARNWSRTIHRQCELVYTRRQAVEPNEDLIEEDSDAAP